MLIEVLLFPCIMAHILYCGAIIFMKKQRLHLMALHTFIQELKKRNVLKVASIYIVTSWLIIQVVATTFPIFELPVWSQRMIVILLILGFPIVLILAWFQENTVKEKGRKNRWLLPIAVLAIGLSGILVWWPGKSEESNQLLPAEIRQERVGVSIFRNMTQDKSLDALGYLASEWITSGLREVEVDIVSPEMMREFNDYVTVFPNNPEGKPAFVDLTGAQYLINGSYFEHGLDSLRINIRLLNTNTGELIREFPSLLFPKSAQEGIVEEARQYLMGYWAAKKDQHFPQVLPPKYEAYQAYLKCHPAWFSCFNEIISIDSTFLLNRINVMWSATWNNQDASFESNSSSGRDHGVGSLESSFLCNLEMHCSNT